MSHKSHHFIPGIILVAATILSMSPAQAQAPSLEGQLAAQYKLAKIGSDTNGYSVVEKGTLLAIKKGGILGVPYSDNSVLGTKYENGQVQTPSAAKKAIRGGLMAKFGKEQQTHLFAAGDKVYPTKIEVRLDKDEVVLSVVACDTCNKTDPPTYNKANVNFQFPKGSLAKASAGEVEATIGQLLAITKEEEEKADDKGGDKGGDQGAQQGGQQGGDQGGGQQAGGDQGAQDQQEPASIEKGMTPDQVEAAMGKPEKKVTLGTKVIYYYKDMKVIFINGKVSDVQ